MWGGREHEPGAELSAQGEPYAGCKLLFSFKAPELTCGGGPEIRYPEKNKIKDRTLDSGPNPLHHTALGELFRGQGCRELAGWAFPEALYLPRQPA